MKFLNYSILIFFLCINCTKTVHHDDLKKLSGYWEIDLVTGTDDAKKSYAINPTIDFFKVGANGNGFRKKMMVNFTGNYSANNRIDSIQVVPDGDAYILKTKTPFDTWEERILTLNANQLILKNDKGIIFQYKRHLKFNVNE